MALQDSILAGRASLSACGGGEGHLNTRRAQGPMAVRSWPALTLRDPAAGGPKGARHGHATPCLQYWGQ